MRPHGDNYFPNTNFIPIDSWVTGIETIFLSPFNKLRQVIPIDSWVTGIETSHNRNDNNSYQKIPIDSWVTGIETVTG